MEGKCVSFNIGPAVNDQVLCQLSDSDHTRHPGDLQPSDGFSYTATEVRNSNRDQVSLVAVLIRHVCCILQVFFSFVMFCLPQ